MSLAIWLTNTHKLANYAQRPWALNKLTVIREGKIRHWVTVVDLSKALSETPSREELSPRELKPIETIFDR